MTEKQSNLLAQTEVAKAFCEELGKFLKENRLKLEAFGCIIENIDYQFFNETTGARLEVEFGSEDTGVKIFTVVQQHC
jgi:hypothetical protein